MVKFDNSENEATYLDVEYGEKIDLDTYVDNKVIQQNFDSFATTKIDGDCKYYLYDRVGKYDSIEILDNKTLVINNTREVSFNIQILVTCQNVKKIVDFYIHIDHNHEYIEVDRRNETCSKSGAIIYKCYCENYFEEIIYPTGHEMVNDVCIHCGTNDDRILEIGDFKVERLSGNYYEVYEYTGNDEYVVVPHVFGQYGEYKIISVRELTFTKRSKLEEVVFEEGITNIDSYAIKDCANIEKISIPSSIETCGVVSNVLPDLTMNYYSGGYYLGNDIEPYLVLIKVSNSISTVSFAQGTKIISDNVFRYNTDIKEIILPLGIKSIGNYVFEGCSNLGRVYIPSSIISIGDYAFKDCYNLTSISLPSDLTYLGKGAFYRCRNIVSVTVPSLVTEINDETFFECEALEKVSLSRYTTKIGTSAFEGCYNMSSFDMPSNVEEIGARAFYCCASLTSVTIPSGVTEIKDNTFLGCIYLIKVIIWGEIETIGDGAFCGCIFLQRISLPDSLTKIGKEAFMGCVQLQSIELGKNLKEIGEYAFDSCEFSKVYIPINVEKIGAYAFTYYDTIFTCEASSKPSGWNALWCHSDSSVTWNNVTM